MRAGALKRMRTAAEIDREAVRLFLRLREDDVRPAEIAEWEAWLKADPRHGEAFDAVADAWAVAGQATVAPAADWQLRSDAYDGSVPVSQWRGRRPGRPWLAWSGAAIAAACALALGLGWLQQTSQDMALQINTARGQQKQAALPDGSRLTLGGASVVDIDFRARRRQITLRSGEAMFQVAHDRSRPFVVRTGLGDMTAVGTAFDVNLRSDAVTLTVTEGVVSVESPALRPRREAAVLRVSAGQRLTIDGGGARLDRLDGGGSSDLAWMSGRLEYRSQPLARVLDDVNRYAAAPIRLADPALGALAYTGTVQLGDIPGWAMGLSGAFPLDVERSQDGSFVLKQKKSAQPLPVQRTKAS
jgi:transmembrane sensor